MNIFPNQGIGALKFGMNPKAVKKLMGSKLIYQDWMGGNLNDSLFYTDLVIGFNDCDSSEPLANSALVEFRANASQRIKFNGFTLAELSREKLRSMVVLGIKAEVDKNNDVLFRSLGINFGFDEAGNVCIMEMWQHKQSS